MGYQSEMLTAKRTRPKTAFRRSCRVKPRKRAHEHGKVCSAAGERGDGVVRRLGGAGRESEGPVETRRGQGRKHEQV